MIGLIATLCFAIGLCVGAILFRQFKSDAAKVELLEQQLQSLQSEYDSYKENVHSHFTTTSTLVNTMTDSYRAVYHHLATGAQTLCPESVSSQLSLSSEAYDLLSFTNSQSQSQEEDNTPDNSNLATDATLSPPRDYSPKSNPNQKGNLAEDFGLNKTLDELKEKNL